MERVGIYAAKANLSNLVDLVGKGAEVTITRHGKAVARLVPVRTRGKPRRAAGFAALDRLRRELGITRRFDLRKIIEEGRR
jgi:prevent-host-death family protein